MRSAALFMILACGPMPMASAIAAAPAPAPAPAPTARLTVTGTPGVNQDIFLNACRFDQDTQGNLLPQSARCLDMTLGEPKELAPGFYLLSYSGSRQGVTLAPGESRAVSLVELQIPRI